MNYIVSLSERAEKNLDDIVEYLTVEWGDKVKRDFIAKFQQTQLYISSNPYMYPLSLFRKNIRRCVLTKHNMIYYRIKKQAGEVEVITIHDTRQHPDKLKM